MTALRYGEENVGPLNPTGMACLQNYEAFTHHTVPRNHTEEQYTNSACDVSEVLLKALQLAGRDLTPTSFVHAVEMVTDLPMAYSGPSVSFSPTRHDGGTMERTIQWTADCKCWKAMGSFEPLPAP